MKIISGRNDEKNRRCVWHILMNPSDEQKRKLVIIMKNENRLQVFGYNARQWHMLSVNAVGVKAADEFMKATENDLAKMNPENMSMSVPLVPAVINYCKVMGIQIVNRLDGMIVAKCRVSFC